LVWLKRPFVGFCGGKMLCHFGLVEETVFVYFCRGKYFKKINYLLLVCILNHFDILNLKINFKK